ncbi:MAG: c-type cytochrome [Planctomycetales bacterium]|nr:c-type cytochrome [Planctomycetales bacterium]
MDAFHFPVVRLLTGGIGIFLVLIAANIVLAQDDEDEEELSRFLPGLVADFVGSDGAVHQRIDEVVSMDWGTGVPDPRMPAGNFSVRWTGRLQVWSTGEYQFRFYSVGKVRLEISGDVLLDDARAEPGWLETEPIEIPWGEQPIEIDFEKAAAGAQVFFFWKGPDFDWEPVSVHSLLHEREQSPDNYFQRGRFLARALRCSACHSISDHQERIDAPALDTLSGTISSAWIVTWLSDNPSGSQPSTDEQIGRRMPHFSMSQADAAAIAAYLTVGPPADRSVKPPAAESAEAGRKLFLSLGCLACHRMGELGESGLFGGGDLSTIAEKRPPGFFQQWLHDPAALNRDHRMPEFALHETEQSQLASYLMTLKTENASTVRNEESHDQAEIERGQSLVMQYRCQNCHRLPTSAAASPSTKIRLDPKNVDWENSCAGQPEIANSNRPAYVLSNEQQTALQVYLKELPQNGQSADLAPDGKFLMHERNCLGCHSRGLVQGIEKQIQVIAGVDHSLERDMAYIKPPALDSVGDKLHDQVLLDSITLRRPIRRNWLLVRMPKYRFEKGEAEAIAGHLVKEDRIPDVPDQSPTGIEEAALRAAGTRLVTTDGFGCTSCHQIGGVKPTHVAFGVHGPDLALIGKEVRYPWFLRWVLNPTRISPRMEMPAVKTPIRGVLDSHLGHQHAAVWAVLNQPGFQPPQPNPVRVIRQRNEAQDADQPIVVVDNVEAEGHSFVKPLLVGLPNRHNLLFDLERYRLAGWTQGDLARQRLRNKYWYWETAGASIFAASKGESEVALQMDQKLLLPVIDPSFPPEADEHRAVGNAWAFDSHLQFRAAGIESSEPVEIKITQTYQPLTEKRASGFVRHLQFAGVPAGAVIKFDAVPGSKTRLDETKRIAKAASPEQIEIECLTEGVRFDEQGNWARLSLLPDANGYCRVALQYRSSIPADRYLQLSPPAIEVEQENLHVVPGFAAQRLPLSEEITPTAFAWDKVGRPLIATLKGRIWRAEDTDADGIEDQAELLADGFSAPFGLATLEENGIEAIDVADKTALLRLTDTDGDGRLDRTRTVASGWGHSNDYHGWIVGLPRDGAGNYFVVVSNRDGPPAHLRGRVLKLEKTADPGSFNREYQVRPLAMGLRFPVGIARSRRGELFVTDNQGQFNPYNELNYVVEGSHFGFFNLNGLEDDPVTKSLPRTGPAVGMPHPWVRSVNGICFLETPSRLLEATGQPLFGPYEGHLLGCECTTRQLVRISLQRVDGQMQGAAYPLTIAPPRGTNSLLRPLVSQIAPDGSILVGSVHDSAWGAGRNVGEIVKLRFNGDLPAGIAEMRALDSGFELEFSKPVDAVKAADPSNYVLASSRRESTPTYGGPEVDRRTEKIVAIEVSSDSKRVTLTLPEMRTGFVYALRLRNLTTTNQQFHPAEAYYSFGPLQ